MHETCLPGVAMTAVGAAASTRTACEMSTTMPCFPPRFVGMLTPLMPGQFDGVASDGLARRYGLFLHAGRGALPPRAADVARRALTRTGTRGRRRPRGTWKGLAARALRCRLVWRPLARGIRRPRRIADRANHLSGGDGARPHAAVDQPGW